MKCCHQVCVSSRNKHRIEIHFRSCPLVITKLPSTHTQLTKGKRVSEYFGRAPYQIWDATKHEYEVFLTCFSRAWTKKINILCVTYEKLSGQNWDKYSKIMLPMMWPDRFMEQNQNRSQIRLFKNWKNRHRNLVTSNKSIIWSKC